MRFGRALEPAMTRELERPEKEGVRRPAFLTCMMHAMSVHDAADARDARDPPHCQPSMDEAVVDEEIGEAERRRANSDTERELAHDADRASASIKNERDRERRVEKRERVVLLEGTRSWPMMRAMDREEEAVPETAMEEPCPKIHQHEYDERRRNPNDVMGNAHR
jgi:hypothetical protein